jgi:hypothetical protein
MLYLILPYFDFNQSILSKNNLDLFISNYSNRANLRIVLCEGIYNEELPDYSDKIFKHLKFKLKNILWVKENLINLAIKNLPDDAEFIAWSDRDIYFVNPSWVEDTIEKLKVYDIVQPWSEVIHLNSCYNLNYISKSKRNISFANKSTLSAKINHSNNESKVSTATGQIWAINKSFYQKIGKLNDIEIIGGADSIFANFCIINDPFYEKILNQKTTIKSKNSWELYKEKFKDIKYSYVDGLIIHYWHGDLQDRKYRERTDTLVSLDYDPNEDISYDENGVLQFTEKGKRLELPIKQYFESRKESEKIIKVLHNPMFYLKYRSQICLIATVNKNYED